MDENDRNNCVVCYLLCAFLLKHELNLSKFSASENEDTKVDFVLVFMPGD